MKLKTPIMKTAMDERAMTQQELADALGMSNATINRAVNGGSIQPKKGEQICRFLGVDLSMAIVPREERTA